MTTRMASTGQQAHLTTANILAFATAAASVGVEAEAGGTAMSKVFQKMFEAVKTGGHDLDAFAHTASLVGEQLSSLQFADLFANDPSRAITKFIQGLHEIHKSGGNVFDVLRDVEFQDVRLKNAVIALAGAGDTLVDTLALGNKAWAENTALTREATIRFNTTAAIVTQLWNRVHDLGIELGGVLMPGFRFLLSVVDLLIVPLRALILAFGALPGPIQGTVIAVFALTAALGPLVIVAGLALKALLLFTTLSSINTVLKLLSGNTVAATGVIGRIVAALNPYVAAVVEAGAATGVMAAQSGLAARAASGLGGAWARALASFVGVVDAARGTTAATTALKTAVEQTAAVATGRLVTGMTVTTAATKTMSTGMGMAAASATMLSTAATTLTTNLATVGVKSLREIKEFVAQMGVAGASAAGVMGGKFAGAVNAAGAASGLTGTALRDKLATGLHTAATEAGTLTRKVEDAANAITGKLLGAVNKASGFGKTVMGAATNAVGSAVGTSVGGLNVWGGPRDREPKWLYGAAGAAAPGAAAAEAGEAMEKAAAKGANLSTILAGLGAMIGSFAKDLWGWIKPLLSISALWGALVDGLAGTIGLLARLGAFLVGTTAGWVALGVAALALIASIPAVNQLLKDLWTILGFVVGKVWDLIKAIVGGGAQVTGTWLSRLGGWLMDWIPGLQQSADAFAAIAGYVRDIADTIERGPKENRLLPSELPDLRRRIGDTDQFTKVTRDPFAIKLATPMPLRDVPHAMGPPEVMDANLALARSFGYVGDAANKAAIHLFIHTSALKSAKETAHAFTEQQKHDLTALIAAGDKTEKEMAEMLSPPTTEGAVKFFKAAWTDANNAIEASAKEAANKIKQLEEEYQKFARTLRGVDTMKAAMDAERFISETPERPGREFSVETQAALSKAFRDTAVMLQQQNGLLDASALRYHALADAYDPVKRAMAALGPLQTQFETHLEDGSEAIRRQVDALEMENVAIWAEARGFTAAAAAARQHAASIRAGMTNTNIAIPGLKFFADQTHRNAVGQTELTMAVYAAGTAMTEYRGRMMPVIEAQARMAMEAQKARQDLSAVGTSLAQLGRSIADMADASGMKIGGLGRAITGMSTAFQGGVNILDGIDLFKEGKLAMEEGKDGTAAMAAGMVQVAAGAMAAAVAIAQVTDQAGRMNRAVAGAMAGAAFGASLGAVAGPWGVVAGAAVGALVGIMRDPAWEQSMNAVGDRWGVAISRGLAEAISRDAGRFFGDEKIASLLHLDKIIEEGGGIESVGTTKVFFMLRDVFVQLERGVLSLTEAARALDSVFMDLVEHSTDEFGLWSRDVKELMRLDLLMGSQSKEMEKLRRAEAAKLGDYFGKIVSGSKDAFKAYSELAEKMKEARKAVEDATKAGDSEGAAKAQDKLNGLLKEQATLAAKGKQELADLGVMAIGAFSAAILAGESFADALRGVQGGLAELFQAYEDLGLSADDPFLKMLGVMSAVLEKAPHLFDAIDGLKGSLIAWANLDMLTPELFGASQRTAMQMYTRMQAQVAAVGGSTRDALLPMQAYLHEAQRRAEDLGVPLDENTQMLIDQSKELGIWSDAGKSATQKLLDGVNGIIAAIDRLAAALLGMPEAPDPYRNWRRPPGPGGGEGGGDDGDGGDDGGGGNTDPPNFARGGRVPRYLSGGTPWRPIGSDTVPAMLTPGEIVLNAAQQASVAGAMTRQDKVLVLGVVTGDGKNPNAIADEAIRRWPDAAGRNEHGIRRAVIDIMRELV